MLVNGVNVRYKKAKKDEGSDSFESTNIRTTHNTIHVSNVNLVDPEKGIGTRIRVGYLSDGTKVRISKRSNQIIPKPNYDHLTYAARTSNKKEGTLDTSATKALEKTYLGEDFNAIRVEFQKYISQKEKIENLLIFDK